MLVIDPSFEVLTCSSTMEEHIERCARVCYKSEDKITENSHKSLIKMLIAKGHEAMLEHASVSVLFVTNRGVSHELVRHRIASFAQESTRYVDYGNRGCVFIRPVWCSKELVGEYPISPESSDSERVSNLALNLPREDWHWFLSMSHAEYHYNWFLNEGWTTQQAREVLPNSVKTEIVVTANIREWRHIFKLRAIGTTGKPHPEMVRIMRPCLEFFRNAWPCFFGDLKMPNKKISEDDDA